MSFKKEHWTLRLYQSSYKTANTGWSLHEWRENWKQQKHGSRETCGEYHERVRKQKASLNENRTENSIYTHDQKETVGISC